MPNLRISVSKRTPGAVPFLVLLPVILFFLSFRANAQDPFITTWKTDNPGASDPDQITIPVFSGETYNYDVYWEDITDPSTNGTITGASAELTITFPATGTYIVEIFGDFPRIYFWNDGNPSDTEKILTIEQWGDIVWSSMEFAFRNASNLEINASAPDAPDLSGVTSTRQMFFGASSMNSNLNHWDVSNVTEMRSMFQQASSFNHPLDNWNVSNVTNMSQMFSEASAFNQDISGWTVTSAVDLGGMFEGASSFNQDISSWEVSNVIWMGNLFLNATSFDQDISSWSVSGVVDMWQMFSGASSFNQNLGGWDITDVTDMTNMLNNSGLSTTNYDNTLTGWSGMTVQSGVTLGATGLEYCSGQTARQTLSNEFDWTITGDSPASGCDPSEVLLTGAPGFRMLSAPIAVSLADLLGPVWTQGASGADYTGGDSNVWTWDSGTGSWDPVTDLSATVSAGTGVLVHIFDEDDYGVPSSAVWPKTLSVSGTLNTLPQSPTINATPEGWTLLGNPVNTGLDWDDFSLSDVEGTVYVWDPAAGDYVFWNGSAGDLTGGILHPFQGFFVQTSPGASSASLDMPSPAATSPDDFFGKEPAEAPFLVRLQMGRIRM